jgi:four helix bundle protein
MKYTTGAEGSGSSSKKEFIQFLNIVRRSTFENANILILLRMRDLISEKGLKSLLNDLDRLYVRPARYLAGGSRAAQARWAGKKLKM